jgi:predicted small metal-binding protein
LDAGLLLEECSARLIGANGVRALARREVGADQEPVAALSKWNEWKCRTMVDELMATCDCGWTARGPQDKLVDKIQEHAREAHGLEITPEQALAQARPVEEPWQPRSPTTPTGSLGQR